MLTVLVLGHATNTAAATWQLQLANTVIGMAVGSRNSAQVQRTSIPKCQHGSRCLLAAAAIAWP
jgi:hypothetical protein